MSSLLPSGWVYVFVSMIHMADGTLELPYEGWEEVPVPQQIETPADGCLFVLQDVGVVDDNNMIRQTPVFDERPILGLTRGRS